MARLPFGQVFGQGLKSSQYVDARNIRGGVINAKELVLAGGTQGVIRSENFVPDPLTGWAIFGDGSAFFGANVQFGGDIIAAAWDGDIPADLSSINDATAGYYLDTSVGAAQFQTLFVGGTDGSIVLQPFNDVGSIIFDIEVLDNDGFITAAEINIGGGSIGALSIAPPWDTGTGAVAAELTLFNAATADGGQWATFADFDHVDFPTGSASAPAIAWSTDPDIGIYFASGTLGFTVNGSVAATFDSSGNFNMGDGNHIDLANSGFLRSSFGDVSTPGLTFSSDTDTGIYRSATNQLAISGGGVFQFGSGNATDVGLTVADGSVGSPGIRWGADGDTGFYRTAANFIQIAAGGVEQAQFLNGGAASSMTLDRRLTDVGNVETLRLDRNTTAGMEPVGWFSSWERDPLTGVKRKHRIVNLGKKNSWWNPAWFMDLKPIKFERIHNPKGHPTSFRSQPIELGFTIENLIEHTNLLTTKGADVGDSPDELALIAVTVLEVQTLHHRIEELERQLAALS